MKTSTNQLKRFALWNTKSTSHKPECPHKVEKKLTPVPTNQFMQEHTHTHTHTHTNTQTHPQTPISTTINTGTSTGITATFITSNATTTTTNAVPAMATTCGSILPVYYIQPLNSMEELAT